MNETFSRVIFARCYCSDPQFGNICRRTFSGPSLRREATLVCVRVCDVSDDVVTCSSVTLNQKKVCSSVFVTSPSTQRPLGSGVHVSVSL